jgi:hypothetical protein
MLSFESSRALWNRKIADVKSDETLAQILDRGTMTDWRYLFQLAANDTSLRSRIVETVMRVPTPLPRFWLAAMASLGETVDWTVTLPHYETGWF